MFLDLVVWVLAFCAADTPVSCISYHEPSGVLVIFFISTSSRVCGVDKVSWVPSQLPALLVVATFVFSFWWQEVSRGGEALKWYLSGNAIEH